MIIDSTFIILGYLLGSISTAIIVCRLLGLADPRAEGSGNPGATNVMRRGGKKAAAITLLGDTLKGFLPVLAAWLASASDWAIAAAGLAAFLGHLYPVFFGFRGGKGVATAFGVLLGLSPWAALLTLVTWLLMAVVVRISSLSAVTAALLTPFYLWWFNLPRAYVGAMLFMVVLLLWRHRGNVERLLSGTEDRIGAGKKG